MAGAAITLLNGECEICSDSVGVEDAWILTIEGESYWFCCADHVESFTDAVTG